MGARGNQWQLQSNDGGEWQITTGLQRDSSLTQREFLRGLQTDTRFRDWFTRQLLELSADAKAIRFECAPFHCDRLNAAMRFVVLSDASLERRCDRVAFSEHFVDAPCSIFENHRGDAVLVIPCPSASRGVEHQHLLSYLRTADEDQIDAFWEAVATAAIERLESVERVWLSTAGDGVAWLHVRVDKKPKYFQYAPFRFCSQSESGQ